MKAGWLAIGFLMGMAFGAGAAVVFLEWAVRQHYDRATRAEVRAMTCEHSLATERVTGQCYGRIARKR